MHIGIDRTRPDGRRHGAAPRRGGVRVVGFDAEPGDRAQALAGEGVLERRRRSSRSRAAARAARRLADGAGRTSDRARRRGRLAGARAGDLIVDGGNAKLQRFAAPRRGARGAGIRFVDCGVSGGVWGLENGYALMFGGDAEAVRLVEPFVQMLAPTPNGLAALRPVRRRPFRQDDPQRHRVRDDAGVRRRLRAAQGQRRVRARRRGDRARCGATAASCARGCSTSPPISSRDDADLARRRAGRRRFGRRPLDRAGSESSRACRRRCCRSR